MLYCKLETIPPSLLSLEKLKWISLASNPIKYLPEGAEEKTEIFEFQRTPSNSLLDKILWSELTGIRPSQEDTILLFENFSGSSKKHLFCVFDGHRGDDAATYCAAHLPRILKVQLDDDNFPS